ncbi:MAG: hypothetical protein KC501_22145 [Myxococcales bacterium]|nr:hypothetical protein [Myxococcales bacterium]
MRSAIPVRTAGGLGLALACACAIGTGTDGVGSAASIGSAGNDDTEGTGVDPSASSADLDESGSFSGGSNSATSGGGETDDPPPGTEVCNGIDDDGDGQIDEDLPMLTCGVGSCEVSVPSCMGGAPQPCTPALPGGEVCNGLDDDCNGTVDDGAPQACSTACGSGVIACAGGVEQPCDAPQPQSEACNLDDDDCDGSYDEGVNGCRVGVHRSLSPSTGEHFYTTDIGEAQCCGFDLESANFYYLYSGPHPGLTAFHRCLTGSGFHFYTQSATCEGTTLEGVMGYIATAAGTAGSVPLYRLYRAANGDHFYTTSAAERDNAINTLGYVAEGVAGYVW